MHTNVACGGDRQLAHAGTSSEKAQAMRKGTSLSFPDLQTVANGLSHNTRTCYLLLDVTCCQMLSVHVGSHLFIMVHHGSSLLFYDSMIFYDILC